MMAWAGHPAPPRRSYDVTRLTLLLALAALAAGCGGASGASTVTRTVTETQTVAGGSGSTGAPATPSCATGDLAAHLGRPSAAAGSTYYELVFANRSGHHCTLFGWPGVSAWNGHQVGSPAQRDKGPRQTVTLAPGASAHAVLQVVDVLNFPRARCRPQRVHALRVYPPDQYTALTVPARLRACSRRGTIFLAVRPIAR